jgi:hypothetical protein
MAGPLKPPGKAIALTLVLAVLGHMLVLGWLATQWRVPAVLQPMAMPLLTRQLLPSASVTAPKPAGAQAGRPSGATKSVANQVADSGTDSLTPTLADVAVTPTNALPTPQEAAQVPLPPAVAAASPLPDPVAPAPLTAASAASAPAATDTLAQWPVDTRLSYKLGGYYRGDLHGDAQVQWQRAADRYQVQVSINLGWLASLVMTSQGRVEPEGLHPLAYEEKLRGVRRALELGETQLVLVDGQRLPRPPRVQDTASQFVELTWRQLTGQLTLEPGRFVRFWLARPGGADEWVYDVVGLETLQTRLGPVPAWHLVPRPLARPRGNITAEMWFAPSLQYLPVRIKLNVGTEANVDLLIDKVEQAEARPEAKTRP